MLLTGALLPAGCFQDYGAVPFISLPQLDGQKRHLGEWRDQVLLINLWATWCTPCLEEIPDFIELQEQYGEQGLQIIGISLDDEAEEVQQYLDTHEVNYPILLAETQAHSVFEKLHNPRGVLPFSVIVNRAGRMVYLKRGLLHKAEAERVLLPLLQEPPPQA